MLFWVVLLCLTGSLGVLVKFGKVAPCDQTALFAARGLVVLAISTLSAAAIHADWNEMRVFAIALIGHPLAIVFVELVETKTLRIRPSFVSISFSFLSSLTWTPILAVFSAI